MLFDGVSFKVERRRPAGARRAERRGQDDAPARARRARRRWTAASWRGRRARASPCTTSGRRRRASGRCASTSSPGRPTWPRSRASCATLEQAMAGGDHDAATLRRYSEAQHRLEHAGGYDWRDRAASVVRGLGFTDDDLDRPLSTFSGGELTRASLARALASQPDLLLLDEPTNHLDIESLEWLEGMLRTLDAAVILVAHDRWFLEAVTTAVLELDGGKSVFFPGAWHVWRLEQAARAQHLAKTAERQAEEIARLERFVERFRYKASKAKQAQSKLKQIERIKAVRVEARAARRRALGFEFLKPPRSGRDVAGRRGPRAASAGDKELLAGATLRDRARRARRARRAERLGQDDAARDDPRQPRSRRPGELRLGHGVMPGVLLAARGRARRARLGARGGDERHRAEAARGAGAARPLPVLRLGRAREAGHRRSRAASGGGLRWRSSSPRARTSSSSTSRRTTSTSSRARRSRSALDAFPGHGAARLARPRAARRGRGPAACVEDRRIVSYPGGWADYVRAQEAEPAAARVARRPAAEAEASSGRSGRRSRGRRRCSSSRREVARAEARVAELEVKLAADWATCRCSRLTARRARISRRCCALGEPLRGVTVVGSWLFSSCKQRRQSFGRSRALPGARAKQRAGEVRCRGEGGASGKGTAGSLPDD